MDLAGLLKTYNVETPEESIRRHNKDYLSSDMKVELLERRKYRYEFDSLQDTLILIAGAENKNCIISEWIDAISIHKNIVKQVEESMNFVDECRKRYTVSSQAHRSMEEAWVLINSNPDEIQQYHKLIRKCENVEQRLEMIDDPKQKAELMHDWENLKAIKPLGDRLDFAQVLFAIDDLIC